MHKEEDGRLTQPRHRVKCGRPVGAEAAEKLSQLLERSADARRRTMSRHVGVPDHAHNMLLGDRITAATMTTMLSSSPPLRKIETPRS